MFDIEGFHEDKSCEPFYESDEDESGMCNSFESKKYFIPIDDRIKLETARLEQFSKKIPYLV